MSSSDQQQSRHNLVTLMVGFCVCVLAFTVRASLERSLFNNASLMQDVWFQVTLLDAYLGFFIFYVWVAWKEQTVLSRVVWFVLIMAFGNMATSLYVVVQIIPHPKTRPVSEILCHRKVKLGSVSVTEEG